MEKDGVYVRAPWGENHWATIIKVYDNGDYKVFDSFEPFIKRVKPEAAQSVAMSYYLRRQVVKPNLFERFMDLINDWLDAASAPALPSKPSPEPPLAPAPTPPTAPPKPSF